MLSIVTSGLNAAQKDLSITANNLANAGTTGFKRSEATFLDLYSNDPTADPRTLIGGGTQLGEIDRSTSQGPMKTTGNVTDLAISGRGFFTLARDDGSIVYTRAGNFTVRADGSIVDSQDNYLQVFSLDEAGKAQVKQATTSAIVPAEKSPGLAKFMTESTKFNLADGVPVGTVVTFKVNGDMASTRYVVTAADRQSGFFSLTSGQLKSSVSDLVTASFSNNSPDVNGQYQSIPEGTVVTFKINGASVGDSYVMTAADRLAGFVTLTSDKLNSSVADQITASFDNNSPDVKGDYQKVFVQGLTIDTKGFIFADFSDGSKKAVGPLAIATFAYEPGLRPIGDTNFAQSVESGDPIMTVAGAPAAGDIRSGMLEESNVDMTAELMQMLKAQQVYNGNARMMQTSVEMISRIVDHI